jgi:hypothetical protein
LKSKGLVTAVYLWKTWKHSYGKDCSERGAVVVDELLENVEVPFVHLSRRK